MPGPQNQRPISLLLVLAGLGGVLLLYRLSSGGPRATQPIHAKPPPGQHDEPTLEHGKLVWSRRVVAVGDLHGDLEHAQTVLRMAGVIDDQAKWIAGNDVLVQTGDIVDRGTHTIDLYRMMQSLRSQSYGVGGSVVSILGNHEVMNAIGDWRYVTGDDIKTFGGWQARQETLSVDGWIGREWLKNYTVTARIPLTPYDSPTHYLAFSHGSLHPTLPILTPFPSRPNAIGHSLLQKALTKPMPNPYPQVGPYPGLPKGTTEEEAMLYGAEGVLWWRGLASDEDEVKVCGWADKLKGRLGVRRIIGGHTPNFERIFHRCNSDIIIIDTGISRAYGGVLSALEIDYKLYSRPGSKGLSVSTGDEDKGEVGGARVVLSPTSGETSKEEEDDTVKVKTTGTIKEFVEVETVHAIYPRGRVRLDRREGVVKLDTSRPAVEHDP